MAHQSAAKSAAQITPEVGIGTAASHCRSRMLISRPANRP
jgi:hypothetical protein